MIDRRDQLEATRVVVRLSRMLERACPDLSLAHYRVLAAVATGDKRASRVAARLALAKPTISASVDALCKRGLLVREEVAGDQRAIALHLSADGERLLAEVEDAMLTRLGDVLARTPDAAAAVTALASLGTALDEIAEERLADRRAGAQ